MERWKEWAESPGALNFYHGHIPLRALSFSQTVTTAEMKRKKAKHFLFILCCSNMTSSISFFCSEPPTTWNNGWEGRRRRAWAGWGKVFSFRLPFILFSSSLIYSLPHKRQGKKCRFIATLGARAPDLNVFSLFEGCSNCCRDYPKVV